MNTASPAGPVRVTLHLSRLLGAFLRACTPVSTRLYSSSFETCPPSPFLSLKKTQAGRIGWESGLRGPRHIACVLLAWLWLCGRCAWRDCCRPVTSWRHPGEPVVLPACHRTQPGQSGGTRLSRACPKERSCPRTECFLAPARRSLEDPGTTSAWTSISDTGSDGSCRSKCGEGRGADFISPPARPFPCLFSPS